MKTISEVISNNISMRSSLEGKNRWKKLFIKRARAQRAIEKISENTPIEHLELTRVSDSNGIQNIILDYFDFEPLSDCSEQSFE